MICIFSPGFYFDTPRRKLSLYVKAAWLVASDVCDLSEKRSDASRLTAGRKG